MASRTVLALSVASLGAALVLSTNDAAAVSIIKDPHPPQYGVEIEPHLDVNFFTWDNYPGTSYGPGLRVGIPIAGPAFVPKINDSVAISFGADLVHFEGYTDSCVNAPGAPCGAAHYEYPGFWALYFPVTLQWNFWLTDKWSVFGEPGLAIRHSFYPSGYCSDFVGFGCYNETRLLFAFYVGGRWHFSDRTALTLRVGYPTGFSVGLSFF